jgi:hypothetical protein
MFFDHCDAKHTSISDFLIALAITDQACDFLLALG